MRDFTKKYFHLNSSAVYNSSAKKSVTENSSWPQRKASLREFNVRERDTKETSDERRIQERKDTSDQREVL